MTCVIEKPFANMHFEIALTHIWKMRNANFQETRPSIIYTISENSRFTRKKRSLISKSDVYLFIFFTNHVVSEFMFEKS